MDRQKKDMLPRMQCDFIKNICRPIYEVGLNINCLFCALSFCFKLIIINECSIPFLFFQLVFTHDFVV